MIGVDYDLFWTLNPKSLTPFVKAFRLKNKREDYMMWSLGLYIRSAIASNFNKSAKYPQKPFSDSKEENTAEKMKERFMRTVNTLNSRFRKEKT